jgi:hypothetical protein
MFAMKYFWKVQDAREEDIEMNISDERATQKFPKIFIARMGCDGASDWLRCSIGEYFIPIFASFAPCHSSRGVRNKHRPIYGLDHSERQFP